MGRFFRVTPTPIQSQFVEAPLDFMYQSLQGKQQELDTTKNYESALRGLLDVEVDPRYDVPTLLEKQKQYEGLIDEYATQLERTGNVNNALTNVQDIQRQITKDRFLQEAPENWKKIQKDIEEYNKALATNKVSDYNKRFQNYYFSGNQWKGTQGDEGTNLYTPGSLYYENQDHHKKANEIMGSINYDGYDWSTAKYQGGAFKVTSKGGKDYIDSNKVLKLASDKSETFLNSTEGQDWVRKVIYDQTGSMVDDANWNKFDKETQDFLKQSATDYLYKAAEEQIFARTNTGSDIDFDAGYDDELDENRPLIMPTTPLSIQNVSWNKTLIKDKLKALSNFGLEDSWFKKYTGLDQDIQHKALFGSSDEVKNFLETGDVNSFVNSTMEKIKVNKNAQDSWNTIKNNFIAGDSRLANYTDEQFLGAFANSLNKLSEANVNMKKYTGSYQTQITNEVLNDVVQRNFISLDEEYNKKSGKGKDSYLSYNDIETVLGGKGYDFLKNANVVGISAGIPNKDGTFGTYEIVEFTGKDGKKYKFAVDPNTEKSQNYNIVNKSIEEKFKGNVDFFNKNLEQNRVETVPVYDGTGNINYIDMIQGGRLNAETQEFENFYIPTYKVGDKRYAYSTQGGGIDITNMNMKDKGDLLNNNQIIIKSNDDMVNDLTESYRRSNYYDNMQLQETDKFKK